MEDKGRVGTKDVSQIAAESRNRTCRTGRKMWEAEPWETKILEKTALKVAESWRNRGRGVGINVGWTRAIWNE